MKILKGVLGIIAAIIVVIQFIRPERNASTPPPEGQIPIPADVREILQVACFDCHTNNTRYPWYAEIQPVGWWLAGHIRDAKKDLNFDELGIYRPRRRFAKLRQIEEMITEGKMPLPSYTIIHRDAILPAEKKEAIIAWTKAMRDSLRAQYPPDSLQIRRQR